MFGGTRLSKHRREAKTEIEKQAWTAAANEHKQGVFRDRSVGRRLMLISESATCQDTAYDPAHSTLYVSLDGMDQETGRFHWLGPSQLH